MKDILLTSEETKEAVGTLLDAARVSENEEQFKIKAEGILSDYVKVEIFFGIRILTSIVSNLEVEELMLFMALLSSSMSRHGRLIRPRTHNCDMHAHKQKDMLIFFHKKKDAV